MNVRMITSRLSTLLILTAFVAGCASTTDTQVSTAKTELSNVERYQAVVNANARQKGVDVRWVNVPDEDDLDEYTQSDSSDEKTNGTH